MSEIIKKKRLFHLFIIIAVSGLGLSGLLYSQSAFCKDNKSINHNTSTEGPLYPGYPVMFDVAGTIDRLADHVIVVNDRSFDFAQEGVTYNTPYNMDTHKSEFKSGDIVGIKLNSDQKVISVWLLHEKK